MKDSGVVVVEQPALWNDLYIGWHAGIRIDRSGDKLREQLREADMDGDGDDDHDSSDDDGNPDSTDEDLEDREIARAIAAALGLDEDSNFAGGLHIGLNRQHGRFVFGGEADISFSEGVKYLASVRGRVGMAFDRLHVYGTAGVAFLKRDDIDVAAYTGPDPDTETGFVVGGGLEYKISPNISFGGDVLYYRFNDQDIGFDDASDNDTALHFEDDFWTVRGRLTFHLDLHGGHRVAHIPMK